MFFANPQLAWAVAVTPGEQVRVKGVAATFFAGNQRGQGRDRSNGTQW